jgi:Protein of unknown function (DUF1573)
MKKIIITLASLLVMGTSVNAQVKSVKKSIKTTATNVTKQVATKDVKKAEQMVKSAVPGNGIPVPPPPPPMPANAPGMPGMPPAAPTAGAAMPQTPAPVQEVYDFDKFATVDKMDHDFGQNIKQLPEGVTTTYTIKNISKEPLLIENVQASCGCTIPTWDKAPIPPGKTGTFQAKYNSQGRPGPFTKNLTIITNRGKKVVAFHGSVEANAPTPTDPAATPAPMPAGH